MRQPLRIVKSTILAVRSIARRAATEVPGRNRFAIALVRQQLDEPGFVLHFLIQNSRGHVVRARIFAEGHIADLAPAANRATLRFQQKRENVYYRGWIGKLCGLASSL